MEWTSVLRWLVAVLVTVSLQQTVSSLNLDVNLMFALDDARGALLAMRSRQPDIVETFTRVTGSGTDVSGSRGASGKVATSMSKGWGSSSRRRSSSTVRRASIVRKVTTVATRKANVNKYLLAINEIEKAIMEAQSMLQTRSTMGKVRKLQMLKDNIKKACASKHFILARKLVGHAIYVASLVTKRRGRRQIGGGAGSVLTDIQNMIGKTQYSQLLAMDGGVTLAFAMDTTGSMDEEIVSAIAIATDIVNQPRSYKVDYILSPFNDPITHPGHGPVTYRPSEEKQQFINVNLGDLTADGGGDCAELAITGIQDIFSASIMEFSPIYVFTDAGPKDASVANIDALLASADAFQTPINFFLSSSGCLQDASIQIYRDLALATGGEVLLFGSGEELEDMSVYIRNALEGGSVIPTDGSTNTITGSRMKRAAPSQQYYTVLVDDTVKTLTASVSTELDTSPSDVQLVNPKGAIFTAAVTRLRRGAAFVITTPMTGNWKITVSSTSGKHTVTCKATSTENIDLSYEFLVSIKYLGNITAMVSPAPITGREATVIIAISGIEKVQPASLKLEILDQNQRRTGISQTLQKYGTSPGRYTAKFGTPPSIPYYYLVIKGTTKKGKPFKRMSPKPVKPQTIVIQTLMARNGYTIAVGDNDGTSMLLGIRNLGATGRFTVTIIDSKNYLKSPVTKNIRVEKDGRSLVRLNFKATATAKKGEMYTFQVVVTGVRSKVKQRKAIMMLIV